MLKRIGARKDTDSPLKQKSHDNFDSGLDNSDSDLKPIDTQRFTISAQEFFSPKNRYRNRTGGPWITSTFFYWSEAGSAQQCIVLYFLFYVRYRTANPNSTLYRLALNSKNLLPSNILASRAERALLLMVSSPEMSRIPSLLYNGTSESTSSLHSSQDTVSALVWISS